MFLAVGLDSFTSAVVAAVAIGLLIFIHELGHFLVAKKVGIRVEVFSLGFGPRLFGFQRGATDYRISLIPIGGYVKMAGDSPGEQSTGGPDEFRSKTVGQRTAVISAGVVMNALFAFVVFPIVFQVGVQFDSPTIGFVDKGGAAWQARLQPGDRILEVDGEHVYGFEDVQTLLALGNDPAGVRVLVERGAQAPFEITVKPRHNATIGASEIGIQPPIASLFVDEDSAAFRQGLRTGDQVSEVDGKQTDPSRGVAELNLALSKRKGEVQVKVRRGDHEIPLTLEPNWVDVGSPWIGIRSADNRVEELRTGVGIDAVGLRIGDEVVAAMGSAVLSFDDYSAALDAVKTGDPFSIDVERGENRLTLRALVADDSIRESLRDDVALGPNSTVIRVVDDAPAMQQGVRSGDEVLFVNEVRVSSFADIHDVITKSKSDPITLKVRRGDTTETIRVNPQKHMENNLGLRVQFLQETFRASGLMDALRVGFENSVGMIRRVILILDRMVIRRTVSPKNLGGVPMIASLSFHYAQMGLTKLFHFLAILSINLAIINLLPIPILDGGHLVFLLIEKIKGSPVSENVIGYAQWAGLILLLSLILFVTYNDILRIFHL
ncbi:MAG: RIP metalloprotease RseP [Planctomycetes bacterium]|nr:RIP metalloprotease RseP [Planctomycetota bacterium]MBI3844663.1 RIP metalloprotease RseP [Planctomycetota bacterium]